MLQFGDDSIIFEYDDIEFIKDFIYSQLDSEWEQYTNRFICEDVKHKDGLKRMNPDAYALYQKLNNFLYSGELKNE